MRSVIKIAMAVCLATAVSFVATSRVQAAIITAVDVEPTGAASFNNNFTLGWGFKPTQQISVESLGAYDHDGDGFPNDVAVGLWKSDGTLLASVAIPLGSGTPITADDFRFKSITPVTLDAGTEYRLGAVGTSGVLRFLHRTSAVFASELMVVGNGFQEDLTANTLTFPDVDSGALNADRFFGPNFTFSTIDSSVVPEPSAVAIWSILGLVAAGARRRRTR